MKKLIAFTMIALIVAIGFATFSPTSGFTAPKNGDMRVWVEFQPSRKGAVQAALNGAGAKFHYTFDELNSFVVTLPHAALRDFSRNPNVVSIEEDVPRYFIAPEPMSVVEPGDPYNEQVVPYGVDAVQARDVWDTNRDDIIDPGAPNGTGIKVCIIDSGFLAEHVDLGSSQVTGGVSQVDNEYLYDGLGHGSHVAGTISALLNDTGVIGVTPGTVDFHIVKIFDNTGEWTNSSDLTAAIYACRDAGANIINMSLGGASGPRKEERAFDSVYASGVLMIAAAGNDNVDDPHYPASYSSVVSVSAVDVNNIKADFSNFGDHVELAAPGVDVLSTVPYIATNSLTVDGVEYVANHIEFAALGSVSGELADGGLCGTTGSWTGQVVLCERGEFSFAEKVLNVQNSGGAAAVIYNNEPGNFLGTMDTETATIIALSISQEDGQDLIPEKLGVLGNLEAHIEQPASGYEAWGGTSMATPHVAGVAALIWSYDDTLTNVDIRNALNATAEDLGDTGRDIYFGYGLVQALDALTYLGYTGGGEINEAPTVTIDSPIDSATFESGEAISFVGSADDLEDDDLSAALVWTANGSEIGTGASFTAVLSDGDHTIAASVTDSGGKTSSAGIYITVGDPDNEHPIVEIENPTEGSVYDTDDPIIFSGSAIDENDGDLSSSLIWVSNIDGDIGFGAEITAILSEGSHTITATATDSHGETGSDVVTIIVLPSQQLDTMRVGAINMEYSRRGRNYTIYTTVTILDAEGNPVEGATVYLITNGTEISGVTGTNGTVTTSITSRNTGTYSSTVNDVILDGFSYDPSLNVITSLSLQVP